MLSSTNTVISAQDYDACLTYSALAEEVGYQLENRSYNSTAMKYDFTGKERDQETSYDYFGARYYDSRIGRWGGIDPITIHSITPYGSMNNNPLIYRDINGKENIVVIGGADIRGQDRYKFVNSGLGAAFDLKSGEPLEPTTIVLLTAYLNKDEINSIQGSIRSGSITNGEVNLIMANSTDELINYLN